MGLFGCKACEAKDEEIVWLRATLEKERRFSAEVAKPGISRHIEPETWDESAAARTAEEAKAEIKTKQPTFPGYERLPESPEVEVT